MENLITDLNICDGQKLIDFDEMKNDNVVVDYVDRLSFLIYTEKIKFDYNIFYKREL